MINAVTDGLIGIGNIQPMQTVQEVNIGITKDLIDIVVKVVDINVNLVCDAGGVE